MELPKKNKEGEYYLSYSQIQLFKKDKGEYYNRYILGEKFIGNKYTDFGIKVGESLEINKFNNFKENEVKTLKQCVRLDEFEKEVRLNFKGFHVVGYVDTNTKDFSRIIDYKTGGKNKEHQYKKVNYTQLCIYALALRQEYGVTPDIAQVNFIRRELDDVDSELLMVGSEQIIIDIDISLNRLKSVYWDILKTAKEIEIFYKKHK